MAGQKHRRSVADDNLEQEYDPGFVARPIRQMMKPVNDKYDDAGNDQEASGTVMEESVFRTKEMNGKV